MRKSGTWIVIIIVVVVALGGYAIFHKSSNTTNTSNNPPATQKTTQTTPPAATSAVILTKTSPSLGQYLTDPNGKALYTFNSDSSGVSNCTGECLANWPAYQATGSTANLPAGISTIKRTDNGQTQYTYNGKPLYFFISDSNGQVTGNNVNGFQVAKPSASSSSSTQPQSSGSPY